jgi:hypothetical protein
MKTNKLLMIGVGMVVLYVLYKKFYATESEETAGAWGKRATRVPTGGMGERIPCNCCGSTFLATKRACAKCKKKPCMFITTS